MGATSIHWTQEESLIRACLREDLRDLQQAVQQPMTVRQLRHHERVLNHLWLTWGDYLDGSQSMQTVDLAYALEEVAERLGCESHLIEAD